MSNLKQNGFEQKIISKQLENRLSQKAKDELVDELKNNPDYFKKFEKDEDFQVFIRQNFKRRDVSLALVESIKDKIDL